MNTVLGHKALIIEMHVWFKMKTHTTWFFHCLFQFALKCALSYGCASQLLKPFICSVCFLLTPITLPQTFLPLHPFVHETSSWSLISPPALLLQLVYCQMPPAHTLPESFNVLMQFIFSGWGRHQFDWAWNIHVYSPVTCEALAKNIVSKTFVAQTILCIYFFPWCWVSNVEIDP